MILGLVLLVAALEAAEQDLHFKLSIINASPKTVATKHQKDEGNNEYMELSHEQSGKLTHTTPFLTATRRGYICQLMGLTPSKCPSAQPQELIFK